MNIHTLFLNRDCNTNVTVPSCSKFEDLNQTLGNTQSVANYFRPSRALDDSLTLSPSTTTVTPPPPTSQDESLPEHNDGGSASAASINIPDNESSFTASPSQTVIRNTKAHTPRSSNYAPVLKNSQRPPAAQQQQPSAGSFFRRKLAEIREQEEKNAAKARSESVSRNHGPSEENSCKTLAPPEAHISDTTMADSSCGPDDKSSLVMGGGEERCVIGMSEEEGCGIDIGELIPNLENFDPAILDLFPANVR